ncbi:helix-turn-helix domain-containing protein [Streptomyces sp. NPDC007095]|uniref:helix-turn-helix domain-containing protein n=1 Tax=Streptomyces sp. NPDC007095 TaxID=3154482 RepID=UPI00340FC50D
MARILYPTDEVAEQLGVGLTTAKALIKSGVLRSVKIGRARRVPAEALHEYVQQLDAEQNGDGARVAAPTPSFEAPIAIQS